jgi:transposase
MIVIGADTHKRSHTLAAVDEATGRALGEVTVAAAPRSFGELLRWARGVGGERVWALEDCRHVSGSLERFLLKRGERVLRVPPKLMAGARESTREPGKSDRIDAVAVARAAIREGLQTLPVAQLAGAELDIRLLVDHRDRLVKQRTALINDLALAAARPLARARDPAARAHRPALAPTPRPPPGPQRAVRARPRRARRAQPHPRAHPRDHRPRARTSRARHRGRATARRGTGLRDADRGQADRRDRRHRTLRQRRQARAALGGRADPRVLWSHRSPPPRSGRQPPAQLRALPTRAHQGPPRPRDPGLPRAKTSRRQDPPRSPQSSQAPPRPPRLAPAPAAHPRPGNRSLPINFLT